jgi:uncharacterized damage-inducible protein DinB
MNLHDIENLYQYDVWATKRIIDMVTPLAQEQYDKNLNSSHGGVRGTLTHIYAADWIWFERWKGNSPTSLIQESDFPTLASLKEKWEGHFTEIEAFVKSLSDKKLREQWSYKDIKGNPHAEPLVHQMQHKVNHSSYHRGQIVTMVRQLGLKAQSTDLINYYRLQEKS